MPDDLDPLAPLADPEHAIESRPLSSLSAAHVVDAQFDRAVAFGAGVAHARCVLQRSAHLHALPVSDRRRRGIATALLMLPTPAERPTVGGEVR